MHFGKLALRTDDQRVGWVPEIGPTLTLATIAMPPQYVSISEKRFRGGEGWNPEKRYGTKNADFCQETDGWKLEISKGVTGQAKVLPAEYEGKNVLVLAFEQGGIKPWVA